ncbi:MAG: DNA-binding response regulator [Winogradskyella sp.]|uniref:LytR/AlgR family response regulator transcription factor n=1 Tax=Winogradskyella sp. TaxID=1883156 RepID=UPI000F3BA075|nr:LytTR family DNA-binding domain-containing protein [Winogradskyella sp.]RNC87824.1 MAG: DNA-binding response regulator [Winogradskyella sp.]
MKAVIVEDEDIASRRLRHLIEELAPECEILTQISSVESGLKWFAENQLPDLIFLDIQLNDGYGFDIIDQLPKHPPIVFTTAYNEYAIRGFKYNGIDYLLKPIDKNELKKALEKYTSIVDTRQNNSADIDSIRQLFTKEYKKRFMVKIGNQFSTYNVEDIAYFMAEDGVIFLYTNKGQKCPIEYTIDQLEEILDPIQFFRINRKYMVSVNAVEEIHSYFNSRLLLKLNPNQEEQIIVSRERTTNFKKWLDM